MIKLLWTKSKMPTGPIMTWFLDEPCSHFAIEFFGKIIVHSNFTGVHPQLSSSFYKWCHVVYEKEYVVDEAYASNLFISILNEYWGRSYDWKWFFNLTWHSIIFKLTGKPIPDGIKDRSRDKFLCTECICFLEPIIGPVNVHNGSPYLLAKELGVTK